MKNNRYKELSVDGQSSGIENYNCEFISFDDIKMKLQNGN